MIGACVLARGVISLSVGEQRLQGYRVTLVNSSAKTGECAGCRDIW